VDEKRIYSTGHFKWRGIYISALGRARGCIRGGGTFGGSLSERAKTETQTGHAPRGDKDTLVKYQWQKAMMEAVRRLNGCEARANRG